MSWYRDRCDITADTRYSVSYLVGVCSLEISSCSLDDAAKYTCSATNTLGQADTSCRVVVHGQSSLHSSLIVPHIAMDMRWVGLG